MTREPTPPNAPQPSTEHEPTSDELTHEPNESATPPAMAPLITNTGGNEDGAPTG